ncbi:MAG: hypothetical protein ABEK59_00870 [Halobacteria archaeon]
MSSARRESDAELPKIESYETEDGTVLYDSENPLAWIKSESAVEIEEKN